MLVPFLVTVALTMIGVVIIAKVAHVAMRRLGLELFDVLLWLGLAEDRRVRSQPNFGNSAFGARRLYRAK